MDKALGPDGFTFAFLKAHWDIIKSDLLGYIKNFERIGKVMKGENSTSITLIPKADDSISLANFRSISLVGCQYKIIAKLLAERLKTVMPDLISENQPAFVAGRQILNGILLENEVVNWALTSKKSLCC